MIITPTSLTINQLFGSTNEQYVIPTYQRRYSWHERQVWELIDDIPRAEAQPHEERAENRIVEFAAA